MKRSKLGLKILLHVLIPLLVGALIYIFYRPNVWMAQQFNLKSVSAVDPPNSFLIKRWIIYSGPDFLWAYSLASALFILNHSYLRKSHGFVFLFVLLLSLGSEVIQLFLASRFTFSVPDVIAILMACTLSAILIRKI